MQMRRITTTNGVEVNLASKFNTFSAPIDLMQAKRDSQSAVQSAHSCSHANGEQ